MTTPNDRLEIQLSQAMRDHVATGKKPVVPEAGATIWNCFMDLSRTRTWHPNGPNPLQWGEIAAWSRLMRMPFDPHHVAQITALDSAWMEATKAKLSGSSSREVLGEFTAEVFDAIF